MSQIVIMAGLPGSGKSTLSRALAAGLAGIVLDKDAIRAALFPEPWLEYSRRQDDFCLEVMLQTAAYLMQRSKPPRFIFLDGRTFSRRYQIERVATLATPCIIQAVCSDELARERLRQPHLAKNRDFTLYLTVKAEFEEIDRPHLTVDTATPLETCLKNCRDYLLMRENAHVNPIGRPDQPV